MLIKRELELREKESKLRGGTASGDVSKYHECEVIIKKALDYGSNKDDSINVFDNINHANSISQFSGGQVRLIDIATILTLAELQTKYTNRNINIMLFDEIFDSLDEENISLVSKILKQISFLKNIIVISHVHFDQIEADDILKF